MGAEDLQHDVFVRVPRIDWIHIRRLVRDYRNSRRLRVREGQRIGFRACEAIDLWIQPLHEPEHVIKRPVFHHQHYHCLDLPDG